MMNMQNIVMSFPFPVMVVDPRRKLVCANQSLRAMFPRASEAVDLALVTRDPMLLETVRKSLAAKAHGTCELRIGFGDVPVRTFNVYISPVMGQDQARTCMGLTIAFMEITDTLEAKRLHSSFVANVSHELRSPLTTLIGAIDTLSGPAANDKIARHRFLDLMMRESQRMKRLINDLLSLSALEVRQKESPTEVIDLRESLMRTIDILTPQAEQASIAFVTSITEDECPVHGDRDELIQVFRNLIENAMKYGDPEKGVHISLTKEDGAVTVDVLNWGEPIAAEHLPRLTQRFYRIDSHRSREQGGTGLGLSIVKYIVKRHKGTLKISSSIEAGTTFSLRIPSL